MAGYDPQRDRMRARAPRPDTDTAAHEPAPVDLLLGATAEPEIAAPDEVTAVATLPDPSDHHRHGPDCDHDHGGIDARALAAGVAMAAALVALVVRRRRAAH